MIDELNRIKKCSITDCENPIKARGYCDKHLQRYYRHGDPLYIKYPIISKPLKPMRETRYCSKEGCNGVHCARGMCRKCYREWQKLNRSK